MTKEVTLRQAGGSVSATLPKDMADRLRLEAGDRVLAVETDRGILLTPYDPETERALRDRRQRRQEVSKRAPGIGQIVRGQAFRAQVAQPNGRRGRFTTTNFANTAGCREFGTRTSSNRLWRDASRSGTTRSAPMCRRSLPRTPSGS